MDRSTIINLNMSKGSRGKFEASINRKRDKLVWSASVNGFDMLNKHYNMSIATVLDAGCRVGVLSHFLMRLGYQVKGVDIVPDFIIEAKNHGIDAVEGDLVELPFEDNSFDSVFCREVMEHLLNPKKVFEEFVRVTKSGGSLFISSPIEEKTSAESHLFAFKNMNFVKTFFEHKNINYKYCGLIEQEPVTLGLGHKMLNQTPKRDCFLLFAAVNKEKS